MKINFTEHECCFAFDLEAETMADAATLTRFGMNRTDNIRHASTNVSKEGKFESGLVIAKNKRANSDVPKRK
jgi:hypothetical protein